MSIIVAIPKFKDEVAPCFEVAGTFVFATIDDNVISATTIVKCEGCEGFGRVRLMFESDINVLICNGIKGFYKDILANYGIKVIDSISVPVEQAIADFSSGKLTHSDQGVEIYNIESNIPLDDIICWTKDLFAANGYEVQKGEQRAPFPIDLVAQLKCPICGKPIRVAICCGAHSYRLDQELLEFHRVSVNDFHAQVYVHPATPELEQRCREFGIELIDPLADSCGVSKKSKKRVPIIQGEIKGHEQLAK
jgi:predicted Fe-Mo cluster-binding NifX family protein